MAHCDGEMAVVNKGRPSDVMYLEFCKVFGKVSRDILSQNCRDRDLIDNELARWM